MTTRTRALLIIVPLFAFVAFVAAFEMYRLNHLALYWALEKEVAGVAVGSAVFYQQQESEQLESRSQMSARYSRLSLNEPIHLLRFIPASRGAKPVDYIGRSEGFHSLYSKSETIEQLRDTPYMFDASLLDSGRIPLALAVAPVKNEEGSVTGYIEVALDAGVHREKLDAIIWLAVWAGLVAILIGIAVALFVAAVISKEMKQVVPNIRKLQARDFRLSFRRSFVEELNELSNTFETMISVVVDIFSRGRQVVNPLEGRRSHVAEVAPSVLGWDSGIQQRCAGSLSYWFGCRQPLSQRSFLCEAVTAEGVQRVALATMKTPCSSLKELVGLAEILKLDLVDGTPEEAFSRISRLCDLSEWYLLEIESFFVEEVVLWKMEKGLPEPGLRKSPIPLRDGEATILSTPGQDPQSESASLHGLVASIREAHPKYPHARIVELLRRLFFERGEQAEGGPDLFFYLVKDSSLELHELDAESSSAEPIPL